MHTLVSLLVLPVEETFHASNAVFLFLLSDAEPFNLAVDPNFGLLSTRQISSCCWPEAARTHLYRVTLSYMPASFP